MGCISSSWPYLGICFECSLHLYRSMSRFDREFCQQMIFLIFGRRFSLSYHRLNWCPIWEGSVLVLPTSSWEALRPTHLDRVETPRALHNQTGFSYERTSLLRIMKSVTCRVEATESTLTNVFVQVMLKHPINISAPRISRERSVFSSENLDVNWFLGDPKGSDIHQTTMS
jgi:hypothetical protein